jgi:hypothetical protein
MDERPQVAPPAVEKGVHVEDIVRGDGGRVGEAIGFRGRRLIGDEAEGRAAAAPAVHLQEDQVVASGEEADPIGGDALLADGAAETVEELAKVILRTHPHEV